MAETFTAWITDVRLLQKQNGGIREIAATLGCRWHSTVRAPQLGNVARRG